MKNLKIATAGKIKLPVLNYHQTVFDYINDSEYQNWLFILYVMDELYTPVKNLNTENFTFNFLNGRLRTDINSRLLDVVYTAAPVSGAPVSPPPNFSPHPNPSVQTFASGYYLARVQQLLTTTTNIGTPPDTDYFTYPAKYVEIIINNSALDVSGNGIFTLIS